MTLWTPEGEHPIGRDRQAEASTAPGPERFERPAGPERELSEEEQTRLDQMAQEMAEVRRQLAEVPATMVVANHAMGLCELAGIHLGQTPPAFEEAALAIDAMAGVVDTVGARLGENEQVLRAALEQIRMAFVQLKSGQEAGEGGETPN